MTKKLLFILTFLFFSGMIFFTLFAESIHNAFLPEVTAARPEKRLFSFEYVDENGKFQSGSSENIAVPSEMLENDIYIIYLAEKNGTKRFLYVLLLCRPAKKVTGIRR